MRAIVTVAIGDEWDRIMALSNSTVSDWAKRIGADRIIISQAKLPTRIHAYQKLQTRELLEKYERIAIVDADILIKPGATDVFSEVPLGSWGARRTHIGDAKLPQTLAEHSTKLGMPYPSRTDQYFDTGFVVCDRSHKDVFRDPPRWVHAFYEQTYLNLRVLESNIPFHDLGFRWNCFETGLTDQAYAIHFKRSLWGKDVGRLLVAMEAKLKSWERS